MKILIAVFFLLFCSLAISAQKTIPVKFKKGATEATVTGTLKNLKDKQFYLIQVKKGQTLHVEQSGESNPVRLTIFSPAGKDVTDYAANCNSNQTIERTVAGNYKIRVVECEKADAWNGKFSLQFTVK